MKHNIFNIINKYPNKQESIKEFSNDALLSNVKMQETNTHFYINNFPGTFGNMQNKNNRIYDQNTLVYATNWFNDVKEKNPYFCYIFDGHKDDDSYEFIAGRILQLKVDHRNKCILMDLKLNKGARSQKTIRNIIEEGDPVGASMRIITPNVITSTKEELKTINNNIIFLEDDNKNIAKLMSNDNEIEYITGEAFIQRFDITQFPSFNYSFVNKPYKFDPIYNKNESFDFNKIKNKNKIKNVKNTSTYFSSDVICSTNSCKFRKEIKNFVDIINIDKSINSTNDKNLYESMMNFSYINLDQFDFNNIKDPGYLKNALDENSYNDIEIYKNIISNIIDDNIINYIIENDTFDADEINNLLINTINAIVDEDNITYQLITLNYLHFIILSTTLLSLTNYNNVNNLANLNKIIESNIIKKDITDSFVFKLYNNFKDEINLYDYINNIFTYLYKYINNYGDRISPLLIVNESMKLFTINKSLTTTKYINK